MQNVKDYIKEGLVPYSGFVIGRNQMPQIKYMDHFLNYIDHLGIPYSKRSASPGSFKPTQFDYDEAKIDRIRNDIQSGTSQDKPIVVSEDMFVVDGHHRYFAYKLENKDINYIYVDLSLNKLLKLMLNYTETYG